MLRVGMFDSHPSFRDDYTNVVGFAPDRKFCPNRNDALIADAHYKGAIRIFGLTSKNASPLLQIDSSFGFAQGHADVAVGIQRYCSIRLSSK